RLLRRRAKGNRVDVFSQRVSGLPCPVIRNTDTGTQLTTIRWGHAAAHEVTLPYWRPWTKPESRCLVPLNSFSEYAPETNPETGKKDVVWFAHGDDRPLSSLAGLWTEFKGDRGTKSKP